MPDPFKFADFKPKLGSHVVVTRTCKECGDRKPITEMRYFGPIVDISRDPAMFVCLSHDITRTKETKMERTESQIQTDSSGQGGPIQEDIRSKI